MIALLPLAALLVARAAAQDSEEQVDPTFYLTGFEVFDTCVNGTAQSPVNIPSDGLPELPEACAPAWLLVDPGALISALGTHMHC